uniref:BTB/POZ domain-containing protein 3 n=1 Tax=Culex pipiens TaxID=7175 RepID=A0A8D8D6B2_CULPI
MAFQHDIPLAVRLSQLVNNEFTADVFFEVGSYHRPMYGHRNILSVGSPVFNAQLNGDFADAKRNSLLNPIAEKDVEEDVFLQILRFIYCENAVVNQQNVVDLYYASQKYLLDNLSKIWRTFFTASCVAKMWLRYSTLIASTSLRR